MTTRVENWDVSTQSNGVGNAAETSSTAFT